MNDEKRKELVKSAVFKLTAERIKERGEIASKAVEEMIKNPFTLEQARKQVEELNKQAGKTNTLDSNGKRTKN